MSQLWNKPPSDFVRYVYHDVLMATQFSLHIEASAHDSNRVRAVAEEVFDEIKRLELLWSRFIEDSEISQINRLKFGETLVISPETHQCLEAALEAKRFTNGHFDVAYLSELSDEAKPPFVLFRRPCRVQSSAKSLKIDFGGIGKGFALDFTADILRNYGYSKALLCASASTILALEAPTAFSGWQVSVEYPDGEKTISLVNSAVSCSGISIRGQHIFDVHQQSFAATGERISIQAKTAALADAFSTAMMTMNDKQRERLVVVASGGF
ncbi:MAG: FAD:protein FMN transferase [Planctomycetaceae bacterium]|jgi:thiamine biosynthesis lipoprotein|nr:FAD:protein FMN transferase [Planctomycetaceae bacterium]